MDILIFAETLYYFTVSTAVILLGMLLAVILYHLICITKSLRRMSDNLDNMSGDLKKRIEEVVERLSELPILSYFLKREGRRESHKKGRK